MAYIKSRKHAVARALPPFGSAAAAATLIALAAPAIAQTSNNTLKEVRVEDSTADEFRVENSANPKFTAPLVDIPQVIQVIPEALMREQGATTLTEALRNTPGAGAFFLGENGNTSTGDSIFMRGFDASSSIFVDGVRDLGSISRDMFNIEQVEVVKGPSGTDVGRTSPTGYINLISKKPKLENSFSGSLTYGSADFGRGTLDWNRVIGAADGSATAFRINAVAEDGGVAGRDEVKNKRWGFAPSIAFGLNTPTRVYLDYLHVKQDNVPDGGVPTIGLPGYTTPDALLINSPILRRTFLNYAQPVDSKNFYGTTSDFNDVTADMFTARVEHDITPDMTLRNITRYGKTQQDYMLTSFMLGGLTATRVGQTSTYRGTVPAVTAGFINTPNPNNPLGWTVTRNLPTNKDQENTIILNQTSLSSKFNTGAFSHTANFGLELLREEQTLGNFYAPGFASVNTTFAPAGSWPVANLYNPNPNVTGYNRISNGTGSFGKTDTVSLYAFDTMKINEQWQLTGGVRYDHYDTSYSATALTLPSRAITPTDLSTSGDLWSGKLGVVYKPAENGSIYAAWGTSSQPPGGANFALAAGGTGSSASRVDFNPQEATTYEVGTKWDVLNKHLSLTAALYRTEVKNEVVQDPTTLLYYQTGKKRVQGIELGAAGAITDNWGVSAGFTTMDTSVQSGPAVTADGSDVLAYTPKNAFTLWTSYQLPFGLTIGGGARYNGKLHRGTDGAIGTPAYTDAYWVFDAMASYRLSKNVELQLNVYNIFDEQYVAAINKSGYRYTPGIPRSARLTANFAF
ncbi:catecholate siderophore receptor Fiu [Variovorax ginsengisoli]|uniref:Catecholate siderophore receptor Fiu n=1 Tax=Variovorax ginsengisoli TaxID=363844 RepID=A0ABT8SBB5_9BURK|nr:catecholate siderophore receptor Fiu [Variovorax ginsengisoli]MDN8616938.1 catecholate siderophore receptor Fiu [Variovorax ginsengisoli]MDO1536108.1 catecholate siderophore receptor Fiu [Variovorax ginsengisoli]